MRRSADHDALRTRIAEYLSAEKLQATNRPAQAEPLMRRAHAIDEQSYGAEHPRVAVDLNNLALLLKDTNRLAEAEPLMRRAVEIYYRFHRSTGHNHPHWHDAFNNYRLLLESLGQPPEDIDAKLNFTD